MEYILINTGSNVTYMCTVPVKIKGSSGNKLFWTYALLDSLRQGTFYIRPFEKSCLYPGRETSLTIKAINDKLKRPPKAFEGLQVSGINDEKNSWVPLLTTFTRGELPVDNDSITKPGQLKQWKYLLSIS